MNFYSYFLKLCNENKEKPSPVAESIGLSRTAVNNWKNGGLPSDINLQKLADHFEIPFSEFFKCEDIAKKHNIPAEEEKEKTATNSDGQLSPEAIRLSNDKEELKRLVDRLTQEEVSFYLSDFRKTILGQ